MPSTSRDAYIRALSGAGRPSRLPRTLRRGTPRPVVPHAEYLAGVIDPAVLTNDLGELVTTLTSRDDAGVLLQAGRELLALELPWPLGTVRNDAVGELFRLAVESARAAPEPAEALLAVQNVLLDIGTTSRTAGRPDVVGSALSEVLVHFDRAERKRSRLGGRSWDARSSVASRLDKHTLNAYHSAVVDHITGAPRDRGWTARPMAPQASRILRDIARAHPRSALAARAHLANAELFSGLSRDDGRSDLAEALSAAVSAGDEGLREVILARLRPLMRADLAEGRVAPALDIVNRLPARSRPGMLGRIAHDLQRAGNLAGAAEVLAGIDPKRGAVPTRRWQTLSDMALRATGRDGRGLEQALAVELLRPAAADPPGNDPRTVALITIARRAIASAEQAPRAARAELFSRAVDGIAPTNATQVEQVRTLAADFALDPPDVPGAKALQASSRLELRFHQQLEARAARWVKTGASPKGAATPASAGAATNQLG